MNKKFIISLVFSFLALFIGVYQLTQYDGRHNIFIGIFWIVYSLVNICTLPKRNSSEDA